MDGSSSVGQYRASYGLNFIYILLTHRRGIWRFQNLWWAPYTDASGKRVERSTGTTNKREALILRNKWQTKKWMKTTQRLEPDRTIERLAVLYLKGTADVKRSSGTDRKRYKALVGFFPVGFFPDGLLMNRPTSGDMREWISHRKVQDIAN